MSYQHLSIEYRHDNAVACLKLKKPSANIITAAMMAELAAAIEMLGANGNIKALILTGEGKNFSFGASVEEHTREQVGTMLPGFHRLISALLRTPLPTFAAVSGYCLGGGFEVALACDYLLADESAKFGVPEIQLGVFPPVAAALAPYKFSQFIAAKFIMSGETFSAESLKHWGLLEMYSPAGKLWDDIDLYVSKYILPRSASSLRMAIKATRFNLVKHFQESISGLEKLYLQDLMATHDANEGIQAFIEKRKANWQNA